MREIKFRGKRIDRDDEARWVYGHYFTTPLTDENSGLPADTGWFFLSGGERMHCIEQNSVSFVIHVDTLGEYTGLKDKNGNRIYEGDIVTDGRYSYEIKWSKQGASFEAKLVGSSLFNWLGDDVMRGRKMPMEEPMLRIRQLKVPMQKQCSSYR